MPTLPPTGHDGDRARIDRAAELVQHTIRADHKIVADRQFSTIAQRQHTNAGVTDVQIIGDIQVRTSTFDIHIAGAELAATPISALVAPTIAPFRIDNSPEPTIAHRELSRQRQRTAGAHHRDIAGTTGSSRRRPLHRR